MKRFKLTKNEAHSEWFWSANDQIGAWLMPHDIIDDICDYWNSPENDKIKVAYPLPFLHGSKFLQVGADNFSKPWDTYRKYLQDCLKDYLSHYPDASEVSPFSIREKYQIQWYPKGVGYSVWHHENSGIRRTAHRHLVFMTYCNDLPNAGTHFKYQNITTPSIKGLTLIWPSAFTHTHKGQVTKEHEKMIVTGWYNFNDIYQKHLEL
jgi:hypothetical protein